MSAWFAPRDLRPGARLRLFCLPHAGSGASAFYRWRAALPGVDVVPVLLPGRELRLREPPAQSLTELADALVEACQSGEVLDVPYAVFGHSMGALVAYRWASALGRAGLPAPRLLVASGRNAPHIPLAHRPLHPLPDADFVAALEARYGGDTAALLQDPEMRAVFLPILRADLRLVEQAGSVLADAPLPTPVLALAGVLDRTVTDEGLQAWADTTAAECQTLRPPGDHFFHFGAGQAALLALLLARLQGAS